MKTRDCMPACGSISSNDTSSVETWIGILQSCRQKKNLDEATRLHAYMQQQQLELHPVLGNYLIPMLMDCGNFVDAKQIFDKLPYRNEHSWTSLISAYVRLGVPQHALCLYQTMRQENCTQPNRVMFLALLNACTDMKDSETGQEIHTEIVKQGLERDIFSGSAMLGNTLVDMYCKCGLLAEARQVFDSLPARNAISWAALLAGYAEDGLGEEAGSCFQQMLAEGICPDSVTFVCSLKACSTAGALHTGQKLHAEAITRGLESDLYLGSALVDMYTKCGSFEESKQVFASQLVHSVVSWNALIAGYIENGPMEDALKSFQQMHLENVPADAVTFLLCLKACSITGVLETGQKLHAEVIRRGFERALFVGNILVDMYIKCGLLLEAQLVFDRLAVRDAASWNSLMAGYAERGLGEEGRMVFHSMQSEGIIPTSVTFVCCLNCCGTIKAIKTGQDIYTDLVKMGLEKELQVGNALMDMYTKCSSLVEAHRVFDRMLVRDEVSWNTLITGYGEEGLDEEVLSCFKQMQLEGVSVDAVTFVICLKACGVVGALETGREIHDNVRKSGLEQELSVGTALVDMYGRCGAVAAGQEVFNKMPKLDVVLWTTMIKAYGENHEGDKAVQCFQNMQKQGVQPNSVTFLCILAACSHASLVIEGQDYFNMMKEHDIEPTEEHYACMVDLYARSGLVYEAERLAATLQGPQSSVVLIALLSASKVFGKVELGHTCFQQLVEVNQDDATAYLLMADVYASAGRWMDVDRIEELRKYAGVKRIPGSAVIEVKKRLHEFVVGSKQSVQISGTLDALGSHIKLFGYVPNLNSDFRHLSHYNKEETVFSSSECKEALIDNSEVLGRLFV